MEYVGPLEPGQVLRRSHSRGPGTFNGFTPVLETCGDQSDVRQRWEYYW